MFKIQSSNYDCRAKRNAVRFFSTDEKNEEIKIQTKILSITMAMNSAVNYLAAIHVNYVE